MTEMIAIRLEKKLNDQLEERLKIEKTTRSNYIRAAIMEKLNKNKEATQLKKNQAALKFAGILQLPEDGKTDRERIAEYLESKYL